MSIIVQIGIFFLICLAGELFSALLPIPIPGSIIAMLLLFLCLLFKLIKPEHIEKKSDFLLGNMAFFFIPAGVSVINYFDVLASNLLPLLAVCVVSTVLTFGVTAYAVSLTRKLMEGRKKHG